MGYPFGTIARTDALSVGMVHPFRYDRAVPTAPTRSDSLRIRAVLLTEARQMLQSDGHPVALNALARRAA